MILWYLPHRRPAKAQASLRICAILPEPSLFAHIKYGSRQRVHPRIRHLAPLDGCACAFEEWVYGGRKVPYLMTWLNFVFMSPQKLVFSETILLNTYYICFYGDFRQIGSHLSLCAFWNLELRCVQNSFFGSWYWYPWQLMVTIGNHLYGFFFSFTPRFKRVTRVSTKHKRVVALETLCLNPRLIPDVTTWLNRTNQIHHFKPCCARRKCANSTVKPGSEGKRSSKNLNKELWLMASNNGRES